MADPPLMDDEMRRIIEDDRAELIGGFCRGCGYCMPCPAGIAINVSARMIQLIRRAVTKNFLTEESQAMMRKVEDCISCNQCKGKCPYQLDVPALLRKNYEDYKEILAGKEI